MNPLLHALYQHDGSDCVDLLSSTSLVSGAHAIIYACGISVSTMTYGGLGVESSGWQLGTPLVAVAELPLLFKSSL